MRKAPPRKHLIFREEIFGLAPDQVLERDVASVCPGQADETRQRRRRHDQLADGSSAFLQLEDQAQPLVGDEREGVGGVDRLRRQDRKDLLAEMLVEPGLGFRLERLVANHVHAGRIELALQGRPNLVLAGRPAGRLRPMIVDSCCADRQAVDGKLLDSDRLVRLQAGDADHEELVEVVGRNRQEPDPLESGCCGLHASSSTRRLKASQLSSRLK